MKNLFECADGRNFKFAKPQAVFRAKTLPGGYSVTPNRNDSAIRLIQTTVAFVGTQCERGCTLASRYRSVCYRGDYRKRLEKANLEGAICYVEHHFNSSENKCAAYTCALVVSSATPITKRWARAYCRCVAERLGTTMRNGDGVVGLLPGDRGFSNIAAAAMPAMLIEPLFVSNVGHARMIRSREGRVALAQALADSIAEVFPNGGIVGLSVGHKYRDSRPQERGASVIGGGNEADLAESVLILAADILEGVG